MCHWRPIESVDLGFRTQQWERRHFHTMPKKAREACKAQRNPTGFHLGWYCSGSVANVLPQNSTGNRSHFLWERPHVLLALTCTPASQVLGCGYVLTTTVSLSTSKGLCPLQTGFSLRAALPRNGPIKTFTMFFKIQLRVAINHGSTKTAFPEWPLHHCV